MLSNERFDFGEVKKAHKSATIQRIVDSNAIVILAVQDTTGIINLPLKSGDLFSNLTSIEPCWP
jgi:hypothetical protein